MNELDYPRRLLGIGDKQGAEKELRRLLRSNPKNVEVWLLLAASLDDQDQKADCYRQVIRLDPENQVALSVLRNIVNSASLQSNKPSTSQSASKPSKVSSSTLNSDISKPKPTPKSPNKLTSIAKKLGLSLTELITVIVMALVVLV